MPVDAQRNDGSTLLVEVLSRHQHLHPHARLEQALSDVAAAAASACCPWAAAKAMRWLQLDPNLPIGRLRRSQLVQLAQSMHRFWQRSTVRGGGNPHMPAHRSTIF